jgi:signal transduction histidine kinase
MPLQSYTATGIDNRHNLWVVHYTDQLYHFNLTSKQFTFAHALLGEVHRGKLIVDSSQTVRFFLGFSKRKPGLQLYEYESGRLKHSFSFFDGKTPASVPIQIRELEVESSGGCWLASDKGLIEFDINTFGYQIYRPPSPLPSNLDDLAITGKDQIICAVLQSGLLSFNKKTHLFAAAPLRHVPDEYSSIRSDQVDFLNKDRSGNLWASFVGKGVDFAALYKQKFQVLKFDHRRQEGSTPTYFRSMLEDYQGSLWSVTKYNGIEIFDAGKTRTKRYGKSHVFPYTLASNYISHLFEDKLHRIWLMGRKGLWVKMPGQERFSLVDEADAYLYGLELLDGRLLFCPYKGGICVLENMPDERYRLTPLEEADATKPYIVLFEDHKRRIWANRQLEAFEVYDAHNLEKIKEIPLSNYPSAWWEDSGRGRLWLGSSIGLTSFNLGDFTHFTLAEKDGLPSTAVMGLVGDDCGYLWTSTNKGLSRMDLKTLRFQNYTLADGLLSLEFSKSASLRRRNGEIWFGTAEGVNWFRPEEVRPLNIAAIPQIVEIYRGDSLARDVVCAETGSTNITEIERFIFPYSEGALTFQLASLEYSDPSANKVRYILEGWDKDTVEAPSGALARYTRIAPGAYTFKVWAANSDGMWNLEPRVLRLDVLPAWWQTLWFRGLVALAVTGFAGFATAFYYRFQLRARLLAAEKQQREAEKQQLLLQQELALRDQRDQIAQGIHDDLGTGLSGIRIAGERLLRQFDPETAPQTVRRIIDTATQLDENRRSLTWATDPDMDTLGSLLARLRREANDLFDQSNIDFSADIPLEFPDRPMPGAHRLHLLRAVKEGLNNALRHAHATEISLQVLVSEEELTILIRDNGRGFDPAAQRTKGKGLRGIEKHLSALGGAAEWLPGAAGGTTLRLAVNSG